MYILCTCILHTLDYTCIRILDMYVYTFVHTYTYILDYGVDRVSSTGNLHSMKKDEDLS